MPGSFDANSLFIDHALRQWSARYIESHEGLKDLRVPLRLPDMMREAGFVDVENRMIPLHTCAWSTGKWSLLGRIIHLSSVRPKRERYWCSKSRKCAAILVIHGHISLH